MRQGKEVPAVHRAEDSLFSRAEEESLVNSPSRRQRSKVHIHNHENMSLGVVACSSGAQVQMVPVQSLGSSFL